MPPRKKRSLTKKTSIVQGNDSIQKRSSTSNDAPDAKRKRTEKTNVNRAKKDTFCWMCHDSGQDLSCRKCPRVYHSKCLNGASDFGDNGTCPECRLVSVDGTPFSRSERITEILTFVLNEVTRRILRKKNYKFDIMLQWPEVVGQEELVRVVDLERLCDDTSDSMTCYGSTAEFYSDVKWIKHNCQIVFGADSEQTKAADNLLKEYKNELLDVESCVECYFHLYCEESKEPNSFIKICNPPHDIVWAKLKGFSYWPAKCLKIRKQSNNESAHVRFFGEHEKADLPVVKCYPLSNRHPEFPKSKLDDTGKAGPKFMQKKPYLFAKDELLAYIDIYEEKYGDFLYHPIKTRYVPTVHESTQSNIQVEAHLRSPRMLTSDSSSNVVDSADHAGVATMEVDEEEDIITEVPVMNEDNTNVEVPCLTLCDSDDEPEAANSETVSADMTSAATLSESPLSPSLNNVERDNPIDNHAVTRVLTSSPVNMSPTFSSDSNFNDVPSTCHRLPHRMTGFGKTIRSATTLDCSNQKQISPNLISQPYNSRRGLQHSSLLPETSANVNSSSEDASPDNIVTSPSVLINAASLPTNPERLVTEKAVEEEVEIVFVSESTGSPGGNARRNDPNQVNSLPAILREEGEEEFKEIYSGALKAMESWVVTAWKVARRCANVEVENCQTQINELQQVVHQLQANDAQAADEMMKLEKEKDSMQVEIQNLQSSLELEKNNSIESRTNASFLIKNIHQNNLNSKQCNIATLERTLKTTEEKLDESNRLLLQLRQEWQKVESENKELQAALQAEKAATSTYVNSLEVNRERITQYKKDDFCCVCLNAANKHCCRNTNYCGKKCQNRHKSDHKIFCTKQDGGRKTLLVKKTNTTFVYASEVTVVNPDLAPSSSDSHSVDPSQESVLFEKGHKYDVINDLLA